MHRPSRPRTPVLVGLLLVASLLASDALPAQGAPPGCKTPMHREFDFWVGEWSVTDSARTKEMGVSSVTLEEAGCVVHEHWRGGPGGHGGGSGQSLNAYDLRTREWGQHWVGSGGDVLDLRGGLRDGSMVLEADQPGPGGTTLKQRITWTPKPDGRVRQLWETSADGGRSWTIAFDGWYRRTP